MPKPRLPRLQREVSRHGRVMWFVRVNRGPRIRLPDTYGTPEFMDAYRLALTGVAPAARTARASHGTIRWLIDRYRHSSAWSALSDATREQRDHIFRAIEDSAGDDPIDALTRKAIRDGRERRKDTPFAANNFLKAVRGLCAWAVEDEKMAVNPARDVAFLATETEGHEPWTIDDVRQYWRRWPIGTRERVWVDVLLYTGFRLGDACAVGRQHVRDGWIDMKAEKTGVDLGIPVLPPLAETLKAGPLGDLAWISNAWGRPFIKESFGNAFRRACNDAGITGKSAHGLRKTLAIHGAEMGLSEKQLQSWFGWVTNRMSGIYTRKANRKTMAKDAAALMQANSGGTFFSLTPLSGSGEQSEKPTKSKVKK